MGDGVGQQAVIGLLGDGVRAQSGNLRRPCVWQAVVGEFHHVEHRRGRSAVDQREILEFFARRIGIGFRQSLVVGLEIDVDVHATGIAMALGKIAHDYGAGEAGLVPHESVDNVVGVAARRLGARRFRMRGARTAGRRSTGARGGDNGVIQL